MGNWRTVEMKGRMNNENEISEIIDYLLVDKHSYDSKASSDDIFYLQFGTGICGINQWVKSNGKIDSCGNLYERDCEIEDLEKELKTIAAKFPSLELIVNAGDDYESTVCVSSFIVKNGVAEKAEPLVKELDGIDESYMMNNLFQSLFGQNK